jgi:phage-related protein
METVLTVRFYISSAGKEPVRDWLKALPAETRKPIGQDIKTVQIGWPLGMPLVRKIETSLWEIRSHVPDGIARVLFTTVGATMVLLHGFIKKSQTMPRADLLVARLRKKEVMHG